MKARFGMTNEQILKKAIEKAVKGGYKWEKPVAFTWGLYYCSPDWWRIIFSHDFAKAFWGEEKAVNGKGHGIGKRWQYHLQQMVLESELLKYLEKFL